jgi:hypothetical protein
MNSIIKRVIKSYLEEKEQGNDKGTRKMSKSYCEKTLCKDMGKKRFVKIWVSLRKRHVDLTKIVISD